MSVNKKYKQSRRRDSARMNSAHVKVTAERFVASSAVGLGALLTAFVASSLLTPVQNSDAYSAMDMEVYNDPTGYYVTVSADAKLTMNVESTYLGATDSAQGTVNVKTNSPTGYKLYISTTDSTTALFLDSDSSKESSGTISAIGGSLAEPIQLTDNTWGYSLNENGGQSTVANGLWAGVPAKDNAQMISASDDATSGTGADLNVYFGVKVTNVLPGGTYGNTVAYTAISEGVQEDKLPTMQDFTASDCQALTTNTPTRLVDSRDTHVYKVTKLVDGNCWMTENLALNGGRTLHTSDSNVTQDRALPTNITAPEASVYDVAQIFSGVAQNNTTTTNDNGHALVSDVKYGNLYNWNAATATVGKQASTGTVTESICPKGWRLPDNTGTKSYSNLLGIMGYPTENKTNAQDANTHKYIEDMQKAPLYIPLAGYYGGAAYDQGHGANLWSRTVHSTSTSAYYFVFVADNGYFNPQNYNSKYLGFSVRCVFGA